MLEPQPDAAALRYRNILLLDNQDSFTYNLVDYLRRLGCQVRVVRNTVPPAAVGTDFDLLVLSPGPSVPAQAGHLMAYVERFYETKPIFGVCLGHQAIVEFFGGRIVNIAPRHGKAEAVVHDGLTIYGGLPATIECARYHSWAADPATVPDALQVSARAADGTVMSVRHKFLPIEGVQFHPESVLSMQQDAGMRLLANVVQGRLANGFGSYRQLMETLQAPDDLERETYESLIQSLLLHRLNEDQKLVLLVALAFRLRTPKALSQFVETLRAHGTLTPDEAYRARAIDLCGTGGSGLPRLNTSTLAALLLSALGVPVLKHGNKAASGRFGSFDLLEALGVPIRLHEDQLRARFAQHGLAFLYAPDAHPVMGHFAGSRARMGIPTLFNILGPLLSPYNPARQLIGTAFAQYQELMFEAGILLGKQHLLVVRGREGLDEISVSVPTDVLEYRDGRRHRLVVQPEDFGIRPVPAEALVVDGPAESVRIAQEIAAGNLRSPHYQLVAANAAFAYSRFGGSGTELPLAASYQLMVDALRDGAIGQQLQAYSGQTVEQPVAVH